MEAHNDVAIYDSISLYRPILKNKKNSVQNTNNPPKKIKMGDTALS